MPETIFDRWDVTAEQLTELVEENPSLRGFGGTQNASTFWRPL